MLLRNIWAILTKPPCSRKLLVEAWLCLAWGRVLKMIPFSRIAPRLGEPMQETACDERPDQMKTIRQVSRALHTMKRFAFWESECLVMAYAAMNMLARRGIDSTLYLGTARDAQGKLIAHAWLRSGTVYVTGGDGRDKFAVVSTFARRTLGRDTLGENAV